MYSTIKVRYDIQVTPQGRCAGVGFELAIKRRAARGLDHWATTSSHISSVTPVLAATNQRRFFSMTGNCRLGLLLSMAAFAKRSTIFYRMPSAFYCWEDLTSKKPGKSASREGQVQDPCLYDENHTKSRLSPALFLTCQDVGGQKSHVPIVEVGALQRTQALNTSCILWLSKVRKDPRTRPRTLRFKCVSPGCLNRCNTVCALLVRSVN